MFTEQPMHNQISIVVTKSEYAICILFVCFVLTCQSPEIPKTDRHIFTAYFGFIVFMFMIFCLYEKIIHDLK